MNAIPTDVLVVGAGTTGLALALQAHDHGARVRVVERREEAFRPSRALIVHPRTLEVLRPLGVTDALLALGDPRASVRLHLGRREIVAELWELPLDDTAFPHLLIESQATVEEVLSDALAARGVEVERGCEIVELRPERDRVLARLQHAGRDDRAVCRFVAGCDGPTSIVRLAAGIGWPGAPYRQEVVLADLELDTDLSSDATLAVAAPGGVLFLFALRERATWRLLSTRQARSNGGAASQPDGPVPARELQELIDAAGFAARVVGVAWSATVPLEHRVATAYRAGPLFLVGDAAHVHSPFGGQGMNTGIQDATNLGWKLAFAASRIERHGTAPRALIDSYEPERRPVAQRTVALTHLLFWGEAGTDPIASWIRGVLVPTIAPAGPFLLRRRHLVATGVRILSQLRIRYRNSPISVEGSPGGEHSGRPGRRLADEPVTVENRQRRLHELLARPGVHLLFERDADRPTIEKLRPCGTCHLIESWPGHGVVGVRPDGHIGYRSGVADSEGIRRWLAVIGVDDMAASETRGR